MFAASAAPVCCKRHACLGIGGLGGRRGDIGNFDNFARPGPIRQPLEQI